MEMEKRLLLLFVISILIIIFYQKYLAPPKGGMKGHISPPEHVKPSSQGKKPASKPVKGEFKLPLPSSGLKGEEIEVTFPLYKATLDSNGAVLKSFILTKYRDEEAQAMDVVKGYRYFLFFLPDRQDLNEILASSTYHTKVEQGEDFKRVVFSLELPQENVRLEKSFTFHPDYRIDVTVKARAPGIKASGIVLGPKIAPKDRVSRYSFSGPVVYNGKRAIEVKLKRRPEASYSSFLWTSLQSLYFTASLVPEGKCKAKIWKGGVKGEYYLALISSGKELNFWTFMGPKDYTLLKGYGIGLEENLRFGAFRILAKPAIEVLNILHRSIPNYGWAIIVLTILTKLVFHPLTIKGYKSMNKMQEIQPYIQQLRKAYKDDPAALNKEVMALYKKYKVNPMGGCLPLILQIPIFFALYKVLMVAIELRHAPFIFWIKDLSAKDPYYITPVLMGLTMLIQQKMTPMGDPTQAKLMLIMPVVLTFLFINFPSGLVIYWLVNNVVTIGEQYLIKHVYR